MPGSLNGGSLNGAIGLDARSGMSNIQGELANLTPPGLSMGMDFGELMNFNI